MPSFWDAMSPFYRRLPTPPPFATEVTADQVGIGFVAAVTGLAVTHGAISYARHRRELATAKAVPVETVPAGAATVAEPTMVATSTQGGEIVDDIVDEKGTDQ
jgi:hypothetical protein